MPTIGKQASVLTEHDVRKDIQEATRGGKMGEKSRDERKGVIGEIKKTTKKEKKKRKWFTSWHRQHRRL